MQILECSLPLPPELTCERCLARLQAEIVGVGGVISAAVNSAAATLHIVYEAERQTPASLETTAQSIGAAIAARVDHHLLRLEDLHCPDCAATLEKDVSRLPGVLWAEIRFASAQMAVEYERDTISLDEIRRIIGSHGVQACPLYPSAASPHSVAGAASWRERWTRNHKTAETALASLLTLLAALTASRIGPGASACLYAAAMLMAGRGGAQTAGRALRARALDMNVLVVVAVLGAIGLNEWFEGATVILLFNVGNLLQIGAMERTRRSIRALMELGPQTARAIRSGEETSVPVEQVAPGEILRVKPGERIPMDGVILKGETTVDQSPITGESLPVRKHPGDSLFGGTLNGPGAIDLEVTHGFQDTMLARIIHWVEEAQTQRAPAQQFIDRFARVYTPLVVALALGIALVPPAALLLSRHFSGSLPLSDIRGASVGAVFAVWLSHALAMLLIACPCALVISMPVAIVTAIGSASRNGVLIKGGAYLEAVGNTKVLLYDKTGTLTQGHCRIEFVLPLAELNGEQIMAVAFALESKSAHPLAAAFTYAPQQSAAARLECEDFCAVPGGGVRGRIGSDTYLLGNTNWLGGVGVGMEAARTALAAAEAAGKTVVALAAEDRPLGLIVIGDTPRPEARQTVRVLAGLGIAHQAMLTGDNAGAAQAVGQAVGLPDIHAHLLPDDKLRWVKTYQGRYGAVAMLGDGINDAPALAAADIGIVMGAAGSATAMETADIALMSDDLSALPYLIRLSRRTRAIVRQNVAFSLLTKGLLLLTAMIAGVPLWLAVLGDVGVSLIVTLNALRLIDGSDARNRQSKRLERRTR